MSVHTITLLYYDVIVIVIVFVISLSLSLSFFLSYGSVTTVLNLSSNRTGCDVFIPFLSEAFLFPFSFPFRIFVVLHRCVPFPLHQLTDGPVDHYPRQSSVCGCTLYVPNYADVRCSAISIYADMRCTVFRYTHSVVTRVGCTQGLEFLSPGCLSAFTQITELILDDNQLTEELRLPLLQSLRVRANLLLSHLHLHKYREGLDGVPRPPTPSPSPPTPPHTRYKECGTTPSVVLSSR